MCKVRIVSIAFLFFLLLIIPGPVLADASLGAKAVYVNGEVNRISVKDKTSHTVNVGDPFMEADRVTTGNDSGLKIEFDTGATLLLDSNTDFVIKKLGKSKRGSVMAVFELAIGMFKSTFSKLAGDDSVEYHTRTAIIGIAGTPPHIIKVDATKKGVARTNVYLLGKKGDKGALFARGFDPAKTEVKLFPGHGSTILAGLAPTAPFVLTPIILKSLEGLLFHSGSGAAAGGATSAGAGGGTVAGGGATSAGISVGTVAAVGGGAAVVAVAAGGSGGGGAGSGGGTTTPTNPTTPTTPTNPTTPTTDDMTGKWGGGWITTSSEFLQDACVGETGTWSASFTQSGDSLSGSWSSSGGESGTVSGTRSGSSANWSIGGSASGSSFSGQVSGSSISGTWHEEDVDCGGTSGTFSGSKQ